MIVDNGPAPADAGYFLFLRQPDQYEVSASPSGHCPLVAGVLDILVQLVLLLPENNESEPMQVIQETYDTPVIYLSAHGQDELVAKAFDLGAADYVVKP